MPLFGSQVLCLCGPEPWKPRFATGAFPLLCHAVPWMQLVANQSSLIIASVAQHFKMCTLSNWWNGSRPCGLNYVSKMAVSSQLASVR